MQPPPYPGFRPDLVSGGQVFPPQQFVPPQAGYPAQPYPQQPASAQQYPGQQFPPQGYPAQQPQYPPQGYPAQQPQFPPQGYPAQQPHFPPQNYPPPPSGDAGNFSPYGAAGSGIPDDPENFKDETLGWTSFTDKAIRRAFIRKVYLIIMVQLIFTLGVVSLFVFEKRVKLYVRRNSFLYYIAYFIFLGVYIALACCGNLRRKYPTNMILLSIFTIAMSYMMGTISSYYDTEIVLMAVGICAAICLAITLFSFNTKFDFTSCGGLLFILVWVLFLFGILTIFTYNKIMSTVYAGCGALLFTLFLAYDTQMLMGGKKHQLSPEEHIFAAMQIYLDIVYIFMFLLSILGSGRK